MTNSTKVLLVAVLCVGTVAVAQTWRLSRTRSQVVREASAKQDAILQAENWRKAAEGTQKALEETVPALEAEVEAAKKAKAPVIIAGRTTTRDVMIEVPSDCPAATPGHPVPVVASTPTVEVSLSGKVETAVAAKDDGTVAIAQRLFVSASRPGWERSVELPVADSDFSFDPRLRKAWAAYVAGPPRTLEGRLLLVGPDWGGRLGVSYFPKGSHIGFAADAEQTWRPTTTCSGSYESCNTSTVKERAYGVGVAVRF